MKSWITNSPEAARALRAADERYRCARLLAGGLCLKEKIEALRAAKRAHEAAYDAVAKIGVHNAV